MFTTYSKYFLKFIIFSKSRQRLLLLAVVGLFISSFALLVLQSTMSGLQNKLKERSVSVIGLGVIYLKKNENSNEVLKLKNYLDHEKVLYSIEYEIEVLLRYQTYLTYVIVHGIDPKYYYPKFLNTESDFSGVIPLELAYKVGVSPPENVQIISPAHTDQLLEEIPRTQTIKLDKIITTNVPEIDQLHLWVKLSAIQNLIQEKLVNRIRIYSNLDLKNLLKILPEGFNYKSWEEENKTLVWALHLESRVMIFLFAAMSLLVAICISSGLLIFFNKIKNDLSSFWILGASYQKIQKSTRLFLHLLTFGSIFLGFITGLIFLYFFNRYAPEIMPDVFVDRKIPILIDIKGILISLFVPYFISSLFITAALKHFKRNYDLLNHIRSVG